MNELEIFINNLIKLNLKDELIINESDFFNNDDIKNSEKCLINKKNVVCKF